MIQAIWAWIKRWWKWVLFPIGALLALAGAISRRRLDPVPAPPLARAGEEALAQVEAANEARDLKLAELQVAHRGRLTSLTEDQKKELKELQEKPLEEVVAWFDKI
jgi:hypothetical protein